jgi:hypothetical protein
MALLRPGVVHADYLKPLPIRPEGLRQIPAALGVGTAYFHKPSTNKLIKAFVHKKNKGQQRAFGNLVRLFASAGVTFRPLGLQAPTRLSSGRCSSRASRHLRKTASEAAWRSII